MTGTFHESFITGQHLIVMYENKIDKNYVVHFVKSHKEPLVYNLTSFSL